MIYESKYKLNAQRIGYGFCVGVLVTVALYWLMQFLIYVAERKLDESKATKLIDFVRAKRDEQVLQEEEAKAPPPVEAMPSADVDEDWEDQTNLIAVSTHAPKVTVDLKSGGGGNEGDYLPIIKVPPIYPISAAERGIEGYCIVEYTVTTTGTVKDISVVEGQCTSSLFHRSSLRAAKKFRYKPRIINGIPIEVPGVQNKFTYQLDN